MKTSPIQRSYNLSRSRMLSLLCPFIFIIGSYNYSYAQTVESFTANGIESEITKFDQKVQELMSNVGIPGLSIAVIDNNQVVYSNGYGYKELGSEEKVDNKTIFEGCSLSKNLLSYAVHKVVEEGKLDMDEPLYKHLPHPDLEYDERYKLITPRMILSHSSGIENWSVYYDIEKLEIVAEPGTKFVYSGEGFNYLAKVVEKILGKSYTEYIQDIILSPLELDRTFVSYETNPTNYAIGHSTVGKKFEKWKNDYVFPASGVHFTADNYARIIASMFDGEHFTKEQINNIITPIVSTSSDDSNLFFGPGFEIIYTDNDTLIAHSGSNDGFKGTMFYSLATKSGLAYLTNSDLGESIAAELFKTTLGFDLSFYYDEISQYPSPILSLLHAYKSHGSEQMFKAITSMKKNKEDAAMMEILNELAWLFFEEEKEVATQVLKTNIAYYPESPEAFYILGELHFESQQYAPAYTNLIKAQSMELSNADLDQMVSYCKEQLNMD
ncbi:MAG: serine hydrolase [Bacteroidota bacterium]